MPDETTTAVDEQGNEMLNTIISLFKKFLAVLLPFIGLDFLTKYLDEINL